MTLFNNTEKTTNILRQGMRTLLAFSLTTFYSKTYLDLIDILILLGYVVGLDLISNLKT